MKFPSNQATAGGGGRGMRLANEPGEFVKLLQVSFEHHK
jgi:acetyl/propionyl-CoA carboxylase alpha subunit